MLLESHTVYLPAQAELDADRAEYGEIGTKCRAQYGEAACDAGNPDHVQVLAEESAPDAIANILHYVEYEAGGETLNGETAVQRVMRMALQTYESDPR